jgi:hypothetical protein
LACSSFRGKLTGDDVASAIAEKRGPSMGRMLGLMTLAVLMLTSCGGSDGADSGSAGDQKLLTVQAVVDELGNGGVTCSGLKMATEGPDGQNQLGTREDGNCSIGGERVNVVTFPADVPATKWVESAQQIGGGIYVAGDTWAVGTETQATADKVKAALGGETR